MTVQIVAHPSRTGAYRLTTQLVVPRERDEVFDFFADAFNLEAITPPWLHFHVLTPRPIDIRVGTLIDYRLRLHGLPIRWRTKITAWEPTERFVDEQLRGPYVFWRHEHTFSDVAGGTLVRDQVDYAVPGGALVHRLLVRRDVQHIFEYRKQVLERHFSQALSSTG
jgi:ligand-binding SRPBCC domain-containing protein